MAKVLRSYRLEKRDLEYIDKLMLKSNLINSQAEAITYFINYHRDDKGFEVQLKQDFASMLETLYYKVIPFGAGALFSYFFVMKRWFFFPFLVIALLPSFVDLEAKNPNVVRLKT